MGGRGALAPCLPLHRPRPRAQPWILNATVKANITFLEPWDEARYAAVLHACALTHDIEVRAG